VRSTSVPAGGNYSVIKGLMSGPSCHGWNFYSKAEAIRHIQNCIEASTENGGWYCYICYDLRPFIEDSRARHFLPFGRRIRHMPRWISTAHLAR